MALDAGEPRRCRRRRRRRPRTGRRRGRRGGWRCRDMDPTLGTRVGRARSGAESPGRGRLVRCPVCAARGRENGVMSFELRAHPARRRPRRRPRRLRGGARGSPARRRGDPGRARRRRRLRGAHRRRALEDASSRRPMPPSPIAEAGDLGVQFFAKGDDGKPLKPEIAINLAAVNKRLLVARASAVRGHARLARRGRRAHHLRPRPARRRPTASSSRPAPSGTDFDRVEADTIIVAVGASPRELPSARSPTASASSPGPSCTT